jgi:poly-gamma-glutamate synthesis protein (capsule biosynthesis protein)
MSGLRILVVALALLGAACSVGAASEAAETSRAPEPNTTATPTNGPAPTTTSIPPATTSTTVPAPPPAPERERLVIHHVGDVNFTNTLHGEFQRHGFDIAFSGMDGIFLRDDLTIVNLECDPSEVGTVMSSKPWSFRCDLASLPAMVRAGVDVTVMANNHSADYGFDSLIDGRANLEAAGLNPVGAGADLAEANAPRIFEIGEWTIGVVAFSGVSGFSYTWERPWTPELDNPWFASEDAPGVAPARFDNMAEVVGALDEVVDIVIVSIHQEPYNDTGVPEPIERERARTVIDAGADVVVAHHHHRLLPFEYLDGVPIFWGMGNFVWSRLDHIRNTTAVAEIVVEPDGTITGRLIPAYIESSGHPVLRGLPDLAVRSDRDGMS